MQIVIRFAELVSAVGPNLDAEFQRAEETYVKDILAPNDVISAGYVTYNIETNNGHNYNGLLAFESASSLTLRKPGGETQVILRREVDGNPKVSSISLMPDNFSADLKPNDVADVIAWIRTPQASMVLLDNNVDLLNSLDHGPGTAEFVPISEETLTLLFESHLRSGTRPKLKAGNIKSWEP